MSPSSQTRPSPQRILATLQAYRDAAVLHTAIELELFTRIAHGVNSVHRIASELRVPERGVRLVCDSLITSGLVTGHCDDMQLAPDAAMFLDKQSPDYLASAEAVYSEPLLRRFQGLTSVVRGTAPVESVATPPAWFDLARGLTETSTAAKALADALDLPSGPLKILDVAAGNGIYGIGLALRYPQSIVVAVDRPAALKVAQQNADAAKLSTRYQNIPGDILAMPFGSEYDVAIVASGLYFLDLSEVTLLFARIRDALKKTGRLFIQEFLWREGDDFAREHAGLGLNLLAATPRGAVYSLAEIEDMLRSSGYVEIRNREIPAAKATLVSAHP